MKVFVHYELVDIDFQKNTFRFYHITLKKMNKTTLQLITRSGKLGNKGKTSIILETNNNDRNLAKAIEKAKELMRQKKKEGFVFQIDVERNLNQLYHRKYCCDLCHDAIGKELYEKIDQWARNEGGWDNSKNCKGYKKVLCIPCQIETGIYKKKIKKKEES